MTDSKPTALVTGAFEGIGRRIAQTLAKNGYRVFGTSRSARDAAYDVEPVQLDLRDPASIQGCVDHVHDVAGHVDLLVSNAGLTIVSPAEELPIDKAQEMMEVNFFGVARLAHALIPGMRAQGSGHLILISSLAGQMGVPGQGFYCSTKHALEGYADGLRAELAGFGIKVTLLEPGSHRTDIIEKSIRPEWPTLDVYDGTREHLRDAAIRENQSGGDPQEVADVVLKAARARSPRLRYRINRDSKQAMFFKSVLPEATFYSFVNKRFGL
jgi:NAD(P)-dependent dehydrogenase (short-subunit alcohol dehydrogenase family)